MASTKLEISELDFDAIKVNLKNFLSQQAEFSDYNFEGSGFAILIDLLAYNTHYLGFNANMLANEMYLDSADIRANVVSLAKMLGYTPSSAKSPVASVDINVNDATGTTLTMDKNTTFTTSVDGTTYNYITNEDITTSPVDGVYKFSNVSLFEFTFQCSPIFSFIYFFKSVILNFYNFIRTPFISIFVNCIFNNFTFIF